MNWHKKGGSQLTTFTKMSMPLPQKTKQSYHRKKRKKTLQNGKNFLLPDTTYFTEEEELLWEIRLRVVQEMKRQNLSYRVLGKKIGVHFTTIQKFVNGDRNIPNIDIVLTLLMWLNLDVTDSYEIVENTVKDLPPISKCIINFMYNIHHILKERVGVYGIERFAAKKTKIRERTYTLFLKTKRSMSTKFLLKSVKRSGYSIMQLCKEKVGKDYVYYRGF